MTYLFIASAQDSESRRPVHLKDFAALFGEDEREHDRVAPPGAFSRALRIQRLVLRRLETSAKALLAQGTAGLGGRGGFDLRRLFSA